MKVKILLFYKQKITKNVAWKSVKNVWFKFSAVLVLKEMHKAVEENNQKKLIDCLKSPHLWKNYSHRLDTMKPIQIADAPLYIKLFEQFYETANSDLIPIDELVYVLKIAHNEIEHAESSNCTFQLEIKFCLRILNGSRSN